MGMVVSGRYFGMDWYFEMEWQSFCGLIQRSMGFGRGQFGGMTQWKAHSAGRWSPAISEHSHFLAIGPEILRRGRLCGWMGMFGEMGKSYSCRCGAKIACGRKNLGQLPLTERGPTGI